MDSSFNISSFRFEFDWTPNNLLTDVQNNITEQILSIVYT